MTVIHLSHNVFYNAVLLVTIVLLLWMLIYVIGAEVSRHLPVQMIAPSPS